MSENAKIELYILSQEQMLHYVLPQNAQGSMQFTLSKATQQGHMLRLRAVKQQWCFVANKEAQFLQIQKPYIPIVEKQHYDVVLNEVSYLILTTQYSSNTHRFQGYRFDKKVLHIGRSEESDIVYANSAISFQHAQLYQDDKGWHLKDLHSQNGCYVNGERCSHVVDIHNKDKIQILELQILINEEVLYINQVKDCHFKACIHPYKMPQCRVYQFSSSPLTPLYLSAKPFVKQSFSIDVPPSIPKPEDTPLLLSLGPSFTMGLSSLSMGVFALLQIRTNRGNLMQSLPTLMMSFTMAIGAILWPLLNRRYSKKKHRKMLSQLKKSYHAYLDTCKESIFTQIQAYEVAQCKTFITLKECMQAIQQQHRLLMEEEHPAFLQVSLGVGEQSYAPVFQESRQGFDIEKQELKQERKTLIQYPYFAKDIPLPLSFIKTRKLWISGDDRKAYLLNLLFLTALLHHESTLKIVLHMDLKMAYESGAIFLVHLMQENGERAYVEEEGNDALQKMLHKIIRKDSRCVVFDFYDAGMDNIEIDTKTTLIQCILNRQNTISAHCASLHLEKGEAALLKDHCISKLRYVLTPIDSLKQAACVLANTTKKVTISQFQALHFLAMYRCGSVEELNISQRWEKADTSHSLKVCIGRKTSQEALMLDLHEHAHGPHGLLAGMTGSGKSECLLTLILSLCISYPPDKVSFLLIDYKGGTMASVLRKLPHVAGVITNLSREQLQRAFLSLQSELLLRQRLMNEAAMRFDRGNMNIAEYSELCALHKELRPLSHLLIIADEFAELKSQQPDFMEQLKQSARIGRSLGIHLLLATQKPAGVIDDQIWSNAHFHLCMKVQSVQDSQDMLKKEDAAFLKQAGECCLQIGYDEVYEKGMIAWSRCPYYPKEVYEEEYCDALVLQNSDGSIKMKRHILKKEEAKVTQMDAIIQEICRLAKQEKRKCTPLWKEPLPLQISKQDYPHALCVLDDIAMQRQYPIFYNDITLSHTLLFGSNLASSTMFFINFLSVVIQCTKQKTLIYILDFAQHDLIAFLHHAYIMDVLEEGEEAKIATFFMMLKAEISKRKKARVSNRLILLIHHYERFHELYASYEEIVQYLLREGKALQIIIYISAMSIEALPYRFLQYPHSSIAFHLEDSSEYYQIFRMTSDLQPKEQIGSGLMLQEKRVCLFQTIYREASDVAALACSYEWQKQYEVATMPKQIAHTIHSSGLYLGKELTSIKDVEVDIKKTSLFYICAAISFLETSIALWKKQLQANHNVCFIHQIIRYQGIEHPYEHLLKIIENADVIVWEEAYSCKNDSIQSYLHKKIMKDHKTHIFIFTMREQMNYTIYEWFSAGFYEAMILWMGKGFMEYRHLFHNQLNLQDTYKKNQGVLMEEETWKLLQLWEVESHG